MTQQIFKTGKRFPFADLPTPYYVGSYTEFSVISQRLLTGHNAVSFTEQYTIPAGCKSVRVYALGDAVRSIKIDGGECLFSVASGGNLIVRNVDNLRFVDKNPMPISVMGYTTLNIDTPRDSDITFTVEFIIYDNEIREKYFNPHDEYIWAPNYMLASGYTAVLAYGS